MICYWVEDAGSKQGGYILPTDVNPKSVQGKVWELEIDLELGVVGKRPLPEDDAGQS